MTEKAIFLITHPNDEGTKVKVLLEAATLTLDGLVEFLIKRKVHIANTKDLKDGAKDNMVLVSRDFRTVLESDEDLRGWWKEASTKELNDRILLSKPQSFVRKSQLDRFLEEVCAGQSVQEFKAIVKVLENQGIDRLENLLHCRWDLFAQWMRESQHSLTTQHPLSDWLGIDDLLITATVWQLRLINLEKPLLDEPKWNRLYEWKKVFRQLKKLRNEHGLYIIKKHDLEHILTEFKYFTKRAHLWRQGPELPEAPPIFELKYKPTEPDQESDKSEVIPVVSSQAFAIDAPERREITVSFLGGTHSGKSFLIHEYLHHTKSSAPYRPKVAQLREGCCQGTSSDVRAYSTEPDGHPVRVLDVEGFDAREGSHPSTIPKDESVPTGSHRNCAVKEILPKLAYMLSDVIVFVSNLSFANNTYLEKLSDFASQAVKNVASSTRPSLIMVYNQCPNTQEMDIERATDSFFRGHEEDRRQLETYFSEVKCLAMPLFQEKEFFSQLARLVDLITKMAQDREVRGNTLQLSNERWMGLVEYVVDNVAKGADPSVAEYLGQFDDDPHVQVAMQHITSAIRETEKKNREEKRKAFESAVERAVKHLALLKVNDPNFDPAPPVTPPPVRADSESKDQRLVKRLDYFLRFGRLMKRVADFMPCGAQYENEQVFCSQSIHHDNHRSVVKHKVFRLFSRETSLAWDGPREPVLSKLKVEEWQLLFERTVGELASMSVAGRLQKAPSIALSSWPKPSAGVQDLLCPYCASKVTVRCGHSCRHFWCETCWQSLPDKNQCLYGCPNVEITGTWYSGLGREEVIGMMARCISHISVLPVKTSEVAGSSKGIALTIRGREASIFLPCIALTLFQRFLRALKNSFSGNQKKAINRPFKEAVAFLWVVYHSQAGDIENQVAEFVSEIDKAGSSYPKNALF